MKRCVLTSVFQPRRFEVIYADAGFQGPCVAGIAERSGTWCVEIVWRLAAHNR